MQHNNRGDMTNAQQRINPYQRKRKDNSKTFLWSERECEKRKERLLGIFDLEKDFYTSVRRVREINGNNDKEIFQYKKKNA